VDAPGGSGVLKPVRARVFSTGRGLAFGGAGVPLGAAFRHNRAHAVNDRAPMPDIPAFRHDRVHAVNDRAPMPDIPACAHDL
jgi:hypothetical protein